MGRILPYEERVSLNIRHHLQRVLAREGKQITLELLQIRLPSFDASAILAQLAILIDAGEVDFARPDGETVTFHLNTKDSHHAKESAHQ